MHGSARRVFRQHLDAEPGAIAVPALGAAHALRGAWSAGPIEGGLSLQSALRRTPKLQTSPAEGLLFPSGVTDFAERLLRGDLEGACAEVSSRQAEGRPLEAVYLQLLVPAAAYIRKLWQEDFCGFADETLALWRLQQVLRSFSVAFRAEAALPMTGRRAMLVPASNEKWDIPYLMFGIALVGEFFQRGGWEAWIEPDPSGAEFLATVRSQWFDVVKLLASSERRLDAIASCIRVIRRESPNPAVGVLVSGRVFIEHPELVAEVGGDTGVDDPLQSVERANGLVRLLSARG